jgi:hypothetical protein
MYLWVRIGEKANDFLVDRYLCVYPGGNSRYSGGQLMAGVGSGVAVSATGGVALIR